ncbi:hypothetical protein MIR68_010270 [Amoeboaphelidium protococcarum]|nr:hypothetical protein MIR68_010270 [Amoeboaphelidium protococcarum]
MFGFGQNNNNNNNQQQQQGGGLFGGNQNQQPQQGSAFTFGSGTTQQQQQQQQPAFGFGAANTANPTSGGFGSTPAFGAGNTAGGTTQQIGWGQQPAAATTSGGFGSSFGQPAGGTTTTPATTSLFGQPAAGQGTTTGTGFGQQHSTSGGFGQQPAAAKPSLFGTGTSGFGTSFGAQQQQPAQTSLFGQPSTTNASTGLFGQQQQQQPLTTSGFGTGGTAFGAPAQAQSSFGQPGATIGGSLFGGANQTASGGFGQQSSTASGFGTIGGAGTTSQATSNVSNNGTGNPKFQVTLEKESQQSVVNSHFQSINIMPEYRNWSFEELRLRDYELGKKSASGASTFQQTTTSTFGQPAASTTGGLFGQQQSNVQKPAFGLGVSTTTTTAPSTFGGFGSALTTQPSTSGFGTTTGAFGTQAPATTSLFGQTGGTQPQQQQQQTGGLFGSGGGNSAFGGGLSQQQGANAQPTTSTGFGSAFGTGGTSTFGSQAQPSASTFGGFGTNAQQTSKPAFSFGSMGSTTTQPATSTGTGGFGSGFGTGFGQQSSTTQTSTQQPSSTLTLFNPSGSQQQQQPAQSSGFGGFNFGTGQSNQQQQQQPSAFGSGLSTTLGASGQQQPSTTGLLSFPSSTAANAGSTGTSQTGGGLFSGFGQQTGATSTTGSTSGNTFGQTGGTSTGFGFNFGGSNQNTSTQQQPQQTTTTGAFNFGGSGGTTLGLQSLTGGTQQTGSLFGQPSTTGFNFGGTSGTQGSQQQQQQQLTASIDTNPYGVSSLLEPKSKVQGERPKSPVKEQKILLAADLKKQLTSSVMKPRVDNLQFTSQRSLGRPLAFTSTQKARSFGPTASQTQIQPQQNVVKSALYSADQFVAKKSIRHLDTSQIAKKPVVVMPLTSNGSSGLTDSILKKRPDARVQSSSSTSFVSETPIRIPTSERKKVTWSGVDQVSSVSGAYTTADHSLNEDHSILPSAADMSSASWPTPARKLDFRSVSPPQNQRHFNGTEGQQSFDGSAQQYTVAPKYKMSPSMNVILEMPESQLKAVHNFTISHEMYGSIKWLVPVDLTEFIVNDNRSYLARIPGEVVVFSKKACEVYPEQIISLGASMNGQMSPQKVWWKNHSVGHGLNKNAEIQLYGCVPSGVDSSQQSHSPRMKQFISKLRNKQNTEFINYDIPTGTWTFRVEHFSRYGLDDEDEEYHVEQQYSAQQSLQKENLTFQNGAQKSYPNVSIYGDRSMDQSANTSQRRILTPYKKHLGDVDLNAGSNLNNINNNQLTSEDVMVDMLKTTLNYDRESQSGVLVEQLIKCFDAGLVNDVNPAVLSKELRFQQDFWSLMQVLLSTTGNVKAFKSLSFRNSLSLWLQSQLDGIISSKLLNSTEDQYEKIFWLLVGRRVGQAVSVAVDNKYLYLASIISQLDEPRSPFGQVYGVYGLPDDVKIDLHKELKQIQSFDGQKKSAPEYLIKILQLLINDFDSIVSSHDIYTGKVKWQLLFAMYFWYFSSPGTGVYDVLDAFLSHVNKVGAKVNVELYNSCLPDLRLTLLCQFMGNNQSASMKQVVAGKDVFRSYLNEKECIPFLWHMFYVLGKCDCEGLSDDKVQNECTSLYVKNLESMGYWKYALFVAGKISDPKERQSSINNLLNKHYTFQSVATNGQIDLVQMDLKDFNRTVSKLTFHGDSDDQSVHVVEDDPELSQIFKSLNIDGKYLYTLTACNAELNQNFLLALVHYVKAGNWQMCADYLLEKGYLWRLVLSNCQQFLQSVIPQLLMKDKSCLKAGQDKQLQLVQKYYSRKASDLSQSVDLLGDLNKTCSLLKSQSDLNIAGALRFMSDSVVDDIMILLDQMVEDAKFDQDGQLLRDLQSAITTSNITSGRRLGIVRQFAMQSFMAV